MNDDITMARFVCRGLSSVPGIDSLSMFIRGQYVSNNNHSHNSSTDDKHFYNLFNNQKKTELSLLKKNKNLEFIKLETIFDHYGFLIVKLNNKRLFSQYRPYIENTLNLVALVIENNTQQQELLNHQNILEKTVQERTKELADANWKLQKEIGERKGAQESLISALKEKEILLQELHHRTKNNMQVIRSMIAIQVASTTNEEAKIIFRDTETRIQTMALVHQKLYQSHDLSRINLGSYVNDLINMIMESYGVSREKISLNLNLVDIPIVIDIAIPCGLLLHELMSNVLKHAFPGERKGMVKIQISREKENMIAICFSDNGIGVPPDFKFRNRDTLGLQTIFALCEHQLQGSIRFEAKEGIACYILLDNKIFEEFV